jgi:O-antigen/teichoic acid export membrane protein
MALYTRGRARRSLIDTAAFRALSQAATILGYVVMVRGMTKEDFGVFSLLYAFIPVVSTVASLGLEQTLRRYQPEYLRAGNLAAASWLVRLVASARFGTNVLVLGATLLAWNYVAPLFKLTPYRGEFLVLCVLALLHFQARILQLSLASHMLHRYSVGSMAVLAIVKLVAYSSLVALGALTLRNALFADIAAFALAYASMFRAYRRHCVPAEQRSRYRPEPSERKRLLRYGLYNNFNDAGTLILSSKSDSFFIAALIDPLTVGIYAFYTRLNEMAHQLLPTRLFDNVIQPLFFSVAQGESERKVPAYFTFLLNLSLLMQWPMLAYATAYHGEIVHVVFGGKFLEQSWLLPVVVAFSTLNVMATPVSLVAQYEERAGIILVSKIFTIYNVAALLLLLPLIGVYGAAVASGSAQALKNLFIWWHVRRRARWTNGWAAILAGAALWGGVVLACEGLKTLIAGPAILHLGIGVVLVGAGFLMHVRGPALATGDRAILASVLRGREAAILRRLGFLSPAGGAGAANGPAD